MSTDFVRDVFTFMGHGRPPVVGSPDGSIWRRKITGAAPPTVGFVAGHAVLALTADSQAQITTLYFGDELGYNIKDLVRVSIWAKFSSASLASNVSAFIGVASAQNDTVASMAQRAGFKVSGNNTLVVDTDDNVIEKLNITTGEKLETTLKRFQIDFTQGTKDVRFHVDNSYGALRRVAARTTFDMSNYSGGLQLLMQHQKASSTDTGNLLIKRIEVDHRIN